MVRHGVVGTVQPIGFVVPYLKIRLSAEHSQQGLRKAGISIGMQDADMPGSPVAAQDRCEAVECDQDGRPTIAHSFGDDGCDPSVVWRMKAIDATLPVDRGKTHVSRNVRAIRYFGDGLG